METKYRRDKAEAEKKLARSQEDLKMRFIIDPNKKDFEIARTTLKRELDDMLKAHADNEEMIKQLKEQYNRDIEKLMSDHYDKLTAGAVASAKRSADAVKSTLNAINDSIKNQFSINFDAKSNINDLKKEESDLRTSYNKREIDYKEYQERLLEISRKRADEESKILSGFGVGMYSGVGQYFENMAEQSRQSVDDILLQQTALKEQLVLIEQEITQIKTAEEEAEYERKLELQQKLAELENKKLEVQQSVATAGTKLLQQSAAVGATAMISSFAKLKAEGASTQKALLVSLLSGLKSSLPVYIGKIMAEALAINPIAGAVIGAGATATLYGLLSAAESSVASAKFYQGGLVQAKKSTEYGIDKIKANLTHNEYVLPSWMVTTGDTLKAVEWARTNRKQLSEWYEKKNGTQNYVYVDSGLRRSEWQNINNNISNKLDAIHSELRYQRGQMTENNLRLERLETADFNKNINIDAVVRGKDTGALIKDIEFRNRLRGRY